MHLHAQDIPIPRTGVATADAEHAQVILDTLAKCAGNQIRATKMLGINRFALMRPLKDLKIPPPERTLRRR